MTEEHMSADDSGGGRGLPVPAAWWEQCPSRNHQDDDSDDVDVSGRDEGTRRGYGLRGEGRKGLLRMTTVFDACNCVNLLTFLCTSNPSSWLLPPFPSTVSTTLSQVQDYLGDYLPTASVRVYPSIRSHGPPDLTTWACWEHRKPEVGDHNVVKGHRRGQPPQYLQGPIQSSWAHNTRHMKSQGK